jgi:hypothetical protein
MGRNVVYVRACKEVPDLDGREAEVDVRVLLSMIWMYLVVIQLDFPGMTISSKGQYYPWPVFTFCHRLLAFTSLAPSHLYAHTPGS